MISGAKPSTLAKTKTPINAQKIKETYGALINMENEAYRRVNVAKRLAPESLTEQLGMLKAAGKFAFAAARGSASGGAAALAEAVATRAAARIIKERNTSDYLLKKAMADYGTYVEKLRKGQRFAIAVPAALNQMTGNP
jgi:predicted polyphosphate/ATP-dependent NAD kinase